jgi:hypothetical protein
LLINAQKGEIKMFEVRSTNPLLSELQPPTMHQHTSPKTPGKKRNLRYYTLDFIKPEIAVGPGRYQDQGTALE